VIEIDFFFPCLSPSIEVAVGMAAVESWRVRAFLFFPSSFSLKLGEDGGKKEEVLLFCFFFSSEAREV